MMKQKQCVLYHWRLLRFSLGFLVLTLIRGSLPASKSTVILMTTVGRSLGPSLSRSVSAEGVNSSAKWTCFPLPPR